jgi:hypothetical protein
MMRLMSRHSSAFSFIGTMGLGVVVVLGALAGCSRSESVSAPGVRLDHQRGDEG